MATDDLNINITGNSTGIEGATKRSKSSIDGVATSAKGLEAAFKTIGRAIDPTFAATERYNKAVAANQELLRQGVIGATEYANTQVRLREALDANVASIEKRTAAGKAAAAAQKADLAGRVAEERAAAAAEKAAAKEVADEKKRQAKAAADAEREEKRRIRDQARADAAEAKRLARETATAERTAARESAEAIKQAKRDQRQAARDAASEAKRSAREVREANAAEARATRDAADAARQKAAAERQAATAARELRASIDPVYAAQQRYNETMRTATQLLMENKLRQGEFTQIQKQAKAQMDLNVRSMGRMNSVYVQMGYQAQDVTASLASGINPMVILAQQGGQTAAALSQMGGTVGRVASFFAGPWGAAIIGFTLLIGFLAGKNKEAEKSTLDLMDAESRRKAKLGDLTDAVKEFAKAQREANQSEEEGLRIKQQLATSGKREAEVALMIAESNLRILKEKASAFGAIETMVSSSSAYGKLTVLNRQIAATESRIRDLKDQVKGWNEASADLVITEVLEDAEAAADKLKNTQREHERWQSSVNEQYKTTTTRINANLKGAERENALTAARNKLREDTKRVTDSLKAAEERLAQAKRDSTAAEKEANKEAKETFKSRTDAIGIAIDELEAKGYAVAGNVQSKGGYTKGHANDADHNKHGADINIPGFGSGNPEAANAVAKRKMDEMVQAYQARGFQVLWNGQVYEPHGQGASYRIKPNKHQHRDHAHLYAPKGIEGKPAGGALGNSLVAEMEQLNKEIAAEQKRMEKEAHDAAIAEMDFRQTLAADDLALVVSIQNEKIAEVKRFYGEQSAEATRAARELILIERRRDAKILENQRASLDAQMEAAMEVEKARKQLAEIDRSIKDDNITGALARGEMKPEEARIARRAALQEEFADQLAHEQRMYQLKADNVRADLALQNLLPEARRALLKELLDLELDYHRKMKVINANHERDANKQRNEQKNAEHAKWQNIAGVATQSLQTIWNGFLTGSQSFMASLASVANNVITMFANMGFKLLQDWIAKQLAMVFVTKGAEAAKTAAVVAGAATQTAVGATAATAELGQRAATSAAGAFSSTVVIPFIGPVAAPVAAAAALAAVLGFGALISAKGGMGEVPGDQLAMVHKKEMILPAWIAEPMRNSLRSPSRATGPSMFGGGGGPGAMGGGGSTSVHISAMDSKSVERVFNKNRRSMGKAARRLARDGFK